MLIYRWTLAYTVSDLLQHEVNEFVEQWNSHRIRQSGSDCIGGIPDDLYDMPRYYGQHFVYCMHNVWIPFGLLTTGVEDYLKPVDGNVGIQAMLDESVGMPAFYPDWFGKLADKDLMESWGIKREDMAPENCKSVYVNLVNFWST